MTPAQNEEVAFTCPATESTHETCPSDDYPPPESQPEKRCLQLSPKTPHSLKCPWNFCFCSVVQPHHILSRIFCLADDGVEALLEPPDGVVAVDAVAGTDSGLGTTAAGDTLTGASHAAVEVHAVDTDTRVVLDAQVDVLADTEAKVAGLAEVALPELVLLDLEATLEDLLGLSATDGDVDGDLFVTADTEGTDGVTGLAWKLEWSVK